MLYKAYVYNWSLKMPKESDDSKPSVEVKLERIIRRKNKKIRNLYIIIAVVVAVFVGAGAFGYVKYDRLASENKKLSNPDESAKQETQRLIDKLSKLTDLPTDESPTIATVTDVEKLKNQQFFEKAQNGDKLFVYNKAKEAILYRPSTEKIIKIGPISSGTSSPDKQEGVKSSTSTSSATDNTAQQPATSTGEQSTPAQ